MAVAKKKVTKVKYKKGGAVKAFKSHMMYNPKTGKGTMAKNMSARKAQMLAKRYKANGGGYKTKK